MLDKRDLEELQRMATNLYDEEKARINRIIRTLTELTTENAKLKSEIAALRATKNA